MKYQHMRYSYANPNCFFRSFCRPTFVSESNMRKPQSNVRKPESNMRKPRLVACIAVNNPSVFPDCVTDGGNQSGQKCVFPFTYRDTTYHSCTKRDIGKPWCSTRTDRSGRHMTGFWGYCPNACMGTVTTVTTTTTTVTTTTTTITTTTTVDCGRENPPTTKNSRFKRATGNVTAPHQYPWMVKTLRCGGSLISDRHVLTAFSPFSCLLYTSDAADE